MRFIYNNEIDDTSYTITTNSENASYPIENVQDYQLTKKYWATGDSDEWVKIDAGAGNGIMAKIAYIAGHNISSGSTVIKIQGNDTDVWTSPTVDQSFTYAAGVMWKEFSPPPPPGLRYWRFKFADAPNPDGIIKIGRLGLGWYYDLTNWAAADFTRRIIDTSTVEKSVTGQDYGDERITYFEYDFTFPYLTDAERIILETMYQAVKRVKPVLFIANPSDATLLPLYGTISKYELHTHRIAWTWTGSMTMTEAL
jgi:hypothetical protein